MQGVLPYVVQRLLWAPVILLIVTLVTFALGRFGPGDPIRILQGQHRDPVVRERIIEKRGLNDNFFVQYGRYMRDVFKGDFGESIGQYRDIPIRDIVFPRMWVSFQYNALAFVIIFGIGIPAGVWSALRRGTWLDPATIGVLLFFPSVPVVITVPVFQWLFALKLDWLPAGGWEVREYFGFLEVGLFSKRIILPILILSLPGIAGVARYMRAQVLEVLDQDFIRTARAKGLREFIVVTRHVVRNALLPIATIMGFALVGLLGGSIFVETLLGIPGIGSYAFEAVGSRDYDGIMALVIITAAAFIVANLLVDIAYGLIDPRIRLGGRTQT